MGYNISTNKYYFQTKHPRIYDKIKMEHWGFLLALEKTVGIGVNARCIEFHEYALNARPICGAHIDTVREWDNIWSYMS
jgi:hypothetical protein